MRIILTIVAAAVAVSMAYAAAIPKVPAGWNIAQEFADMIQYIKDNKSLWNGPIRGCHLVGEPCE